MAYTLFGSNPDGTPVAQVQQGKYTGEFDVATAAGNTSTAQSMDWAFVSGDDFLDLTNPAQPVVPTGLYYVLASFWWNENETGAAITLELSLGSAVTYTDTDLAVVHPGASAGGNGTQMITRLVATEGEVIAAGIEHSRASTGVDPSEPLTGGFEAYVTRIY